MSTSDQEIVPFENKKIRRVWHEEQWYFSVVDIVAVLTDQSDDLKARKCWNRLAQRLRDEGSEVVTNCHRLKIVAPGGSREIHLKRSRKVPANRSLRTAIIWD